MALIKCGGGELKFKKYALASNRYGTANAEILYDNGSGAQTWTGNVETAYTSSDLFSMRFTSSTMTFTIKETCNVLYCDEAGNHFEGVKNANDTITTPQSRDLSIFAYTV